VIGARVVTVGAAHVAARDDAAGLMVARALLSEGLPVLSREVVDEDEAALEVALGAAGRADLVVVLAAPGGSAGEIVRRVVARTAGARLILHERLLDLMQEEFAERGQAMPRRVDRLALLPQGAELWPAPAGEPGWAIETPHGLTVVLPLGATHLVELVESRLRPAARGRLALGGTSFLRTLRATGLSPGDVEDRLSAWLGREGPVEVSCLPVDADVWVRLLARGASRSLAEAALASVEPAVREALGAACYGADEDTLEGVVGRLLTDRGLRVAVAESCTGGLLTHRLTNVPGSSRFFERGVVVYSREAKEALLGVPEALLRAHGTASAPVTEAMLDGICRTSGSPCGLAVTGIVHPEGGTPDKPVGTVFVGARAPGGVRAQRFRFAGTREAIQRQASQAALDMLRRLLAGA